MSRLLQAVEGVLGDERVVRFVDATLLCLGFTATVASAAALVRAAIGRARGGRGRRQGEAY